MFKLNRFLLLLSIIAVMTVVGCNKDSSSGGKQKSLWEQSALYSIIQKGELKVCTDPGYEPFEMRNRNGDVIGFDIDIAKEMADALGVKLVVVTSAFDGIIPALLTDKCDMILAGVTITPERNIQVNFPHAYLQIGQTILLNKKHEGKVLTYKDLNDPKYTIVSRLGVTGGFVAREMMPNATLKLFDGESEAVLEVVSGKADAFIYDFPLCASYYQDYSDSLVFLDEPFTYEPLGMAIRKGDPDFINWIDNFMMQLKGDGRYEEMYNYWFIDGDWKESLRG